MKKLLVAAAAAVSLIALLPQPAHAASEVRATKTNIAGCPTFTVRAALQQPRLVTSQPFNLAYGAEIGNHFPGPITRCDAMHELRIAYYLYALPVGGPRSLVAPANGTSFCNPCSEIFNNSSATLPPGIYELVADFYVDGPIVTSVTTGPFLYTGFELQKL